MNKSDSLLDTLITDLIDELPLETRVRAVNLEEEELKVLEAALGKLLTYRLEKLDEQVNKELLKECVERSGNESLDDTGASTFIIKEFWKRLRESHRFSL